VAPALMGTVKSLLSPAFLALDEILRRACTSNPPKNPFHPEKVTFRAIRHFDTNFAKKQKISY
jgi:hypothetical protein